MRRKNKEEKERIKNLGEERKNYGRNEIIGSGPENMGELDYKEFNHDTSDTLKGVRIPKKER